MTAGVSAVRRGYLQRCERISWRHPEWWSVGLSASAWAALLVSHATRVGDPGWPTGSPSVHHEHGALIAGAWLPELGHWLLMVLAMMVPLAIGPITITAARSLWRRRHRAIAAFLVGYVSPWVIVGVPASAFAVVARANEPRHALLAVAASFALAAAWQITPSKRRALVSCGQTAPLAPDGWRAARDCITYGWLIGTRCVASCWALMAVCVVARHTLVVVAIVSLIGYSERITPVATPAAISAILAGLALAACALAFV